MNKKEKTFFIRQFINGKLIAYKKVIATEEDFKALEQFLLKSQDGLERIGYMDFLIQGYNVKKKKPDIDYFRIVIDNLTKTEKELKRALIGRTLNNIKIKKVKYISYTTEKAPQNRKKGNQLEKLTEQKLKEKGYKIIPRYEKIFDDGGIDIIAEKGNKILLIQCKNWDNIQISQKTIREFLGACELWKEENKEKVKGKKIEKYLIVNQNTPLTDFAEKVLKNTNLIKLVRLNTDEGDSRN